MSQHHHDEESDMVNKLNGNNISLRRHTHAHLNLKPTTVFDHIKTKIKRKRNLSNGLQEIPAFATNNNSNGNHILKGFSQEHCELDLQNALIGTYSQPIIFTGKPSDQGSIGSYENETNEENEPSIKKDENNGILPDHRNKDEEINETRLNPIELDIDNNQKNTKSRLKLNRVSICHCELINPLSTKKKRQTVQRTVQLNKKNKRNDLYNMENLPYLSGFQIRDEDFNNIFNDLPSDEQLIVAYPCAWRKDIFMHGRMFLAMNYVCFYTCFFKWEESLCIAYKDIVSVTKEKSGNVLPNAIQLRTKNREEYLFASYIPRERVFIAIFRLWQNALFEKPLDYQQIKTIVYAEQMNIDGSTGDSEESVVLENNEEHSRNNSFRSKSLPQISPNHSTESSAAFIQSYDRIVSSSPPSEQTTYVSSCPCETHLARTYADRLLSCPINQLMELIFGNNSFTRAYRDSQKLTDYTVGEWRINNENGKRERQVTYKTVSQSILGTNTIFCNEKQIIEVEKPHSLYIVSTEVYNEGMKYTDAFFVATRFCMFQRDAKNSSLRISAEIRYIKNVNGIAKAFIEKNCNANMEDGINNLIRRLENYQSTIKNRKSSKKQTSPSKQRLGKKKDDDTNPDENNDVSILNNVDSSENQVPIKEMTITGKGFFFDMALFIGIIILLLHFYLCYKLYSIDQALYSLNSTCLNPCTKDCMKNKFHQ